VEILGLNPKKDFRFADLSGVDITGVNSKDFDFEGALIE